MSRSSLERPLTIALPKGRLFESILSFFSTVGIHFDLRKREFISQSRDGSLRILRVKNSDLPHYVASGVADLGVVGTDILGEHSYEFFRLFTFPFGSARICLASLKDAPEASIPLRIATKYIRFSHNLFDSRGQTVIFIPLSGSVEIAPILGLSDYIVDLVDTGKTLVANGLRIREVLCSTSVVLIANQAHYKFLYSSVDNFLDRLDQSRKIGGYHND